MYDTNVLEIEDLIEYIHNTTNKIIIFGLSETTKSFIDDIKIDYIIDNNKLLWDSYFQNIQIKSPTILHDIEHSTIIIWGNHINSMVSQLRDFNQHQIIVCTTNEKNTFKIQLDYLTIQNKINSKKQLFKEMINVIDIELYSYCNRVCWFCPNSFIDRKKDIKYINKEIYVQLLEDLASINYCGKISFNGYSEPFGNKYFYENLLLAHQYLPDATLYANTNTDFLTNVTLEKAYQSGLKVLNIQLYLEDNEIFTSELIDSKMNKLKSKISNVDFEIAFITKDFIEYKSIYKDMKIRTYARDFRQNGINRSDIVVNTKKFFRTAPCEAIFTQIIVNHLGEVLPCCHIRTDYEKFKHYAIGNLTLDKNSIFDIFFNNKAIQWRKSLYQFDKELQNPCNECSFMQIKDNKENRKNSNDLYSQLMTNKKNL